MTEKSYFSVNYSCASDTATLHDFLRLAWINKIRAVELRNDRGKAALEMPPETLRAQLSRAGVAPVAINALQRFNDWTPERAEQAKRLVDRAHALGATGIVMCPVIDPDTGWDRTRAADHLREGLTAMAPILSGTGVAGLVEPLGMRGSTLKFQKDAVAAVEETGGWDLFQLCHDTFQFYRCGDDQMYPEHFGMVHVSGISRTDLDPADLQETDRGLVFADDRAGNVAQLRQIIAAGYTGPISMEIFNPETRNDPDLPKRLGESFAYLTQNIF